MQVIEGEKTDCLSQYVSNMENAEKSEKNAFCCLFVQSLPTLRDFMDLPTPSPPSALPRSNSSPPEYHPSILPLVSPSSFCLPLSPTSASSPGYPVFSLCGQSTSVLPLISFPQVSGLALFPGVWTGLIFLRSKALSEFSSNTTVQKHLSSFAQPSLWSSSRSHRLLRGIPLL